MSSPARAGSTSMPDGGGLDERVEVAAEGHVVGHLAEARRRPRPGRARAGRRGRCGCVTASARPPATATRASTRPAGRVEAHDRLGLAHLDHAGLDEDGGHADGAVAAHRQAAGDLDEEHAPVGVVARRRLQDRSRHRRVPARLAHQQQAQVVALGLEAQLALEHRRAGQRPDPAGDDPRRHALGVRVDGGQVAGGPQACDLDARARPAPRAARRARRRRAAGAARASARRRSRPRPSPP